MIYTRTPSKVGKMTSFLADTGFIKTKPDSWKDFFFAEAHGLPGS
jgi:NitT/TauT family transport system substrate-binding protein